MVVLRPAYAWDCEVCGLENFCNGFVPEMSEEDERTLREEQGIELFDDGVFTVMPTEVTCAFCGNSFETTHYGES